MTDTRTRTALTLALCSATMVGACGGGGAPLAEAVDGAVHTIASAAAAQAGTAEAPAGGGSAAAATEPGVRDAAPAPDTATVPAEGPGTRRPFWPSWTPTAAGVAAPAPGSTPAALAPAPDAAAPAVAPAGPAPAPTPAAVPASPPATAAAVPTLGDCQLFPANAIFNTRIDDPARFPAHASSSQWIAAAGGQLPFGADWGFHENPANYGDYYGMPVNVIDGTSASTSWPVVSFDFSTSGAYWERGWPYKSDCAAPSGGGYGIARDCTSVPPEQRRFPFPYDGQIVNEDGLCSDPNTCGDRHVLVVERGACRLWESFFAYKLGGQWYSLATAAWDLKSNALRPKDWASADAAGLPMTPLLVKVDEADSGEIRHALRVNFRDAAIALQYVWPARFAAGGDNPGAMPFGALLRLKKDFVIPDWWTTQAKAVARAAQRYGMYVADNGGDFHVQGEPSARWQLQTSLQLKAITLNDMEFVDLKSITTDPRFSDDSMAASW